ncbi:cation:proton antiporter [Parapedobacter sp. GCM10030251]|uniref:cation:proton antiporter domain-containing protein n=1 Tax=Parapedobacter sp. GCM10030251 TaxID=3273419 RepID=UPI00362333FA
MELPEIVTGIRAQGIPLRTAIGYGILVTAVLIGARIISSYAALVATAIFRPSVRPRFTSAGRRWLMPMLLGWTGMRGVVSLAAALAIPVKLDNGMAFPHRDLILFITFVAILLTLLVQGFTLPYLIKRTALFDGIFNEEEEEATRMKMKQGLKQHVYQFLKNKYEADLIGMAGMDKFMKQWEERAKSMEADTWMNEKTKTIFIELLASQREYLTELNKDPKIDEEIIRQQLYQLDLEEERLRIV